MVLPPAREYMVASTLATLLGLVACAVVFLPSLRPRAVAREFVRTDWKYLGVAWVVSNVATTVAEDFHVPHTYTDVVYGIEGSAVAATQTVTALPLTLYFATVYLVAFPVLVLFTYYELKAHDRARAKRYELAHVLVVVVAIPFFLRFPVKIPGLYPPAGVESVVLDLHPTIAAGMLATDTMLKSFPSLHTALSTLVALFARGTTKRFAYTVYVLAASIVFSTFYLGMHWFVDAGFAIVLAVAAYAVSTRVDPDRVLPFPGYRWVVRSIASRGD